MDTRATLHFDRYGVLLIVGLVAPAVACDALPTHIDNSTAASNAPGGIVGGDGDDDPSNDDAARNGAYAGGDANTFDHAEDLGQNGGRDPFDILAERQDEGPPEVRARLHSCQKIQVAALGRLLDALGVDLAATGNPPTAGQLYAGGKDALGAANYPSRTPEATTWTASGATKLMDIFVQAAPEIIAHIATAAHCQVDGVGHDIFDPDGSCNADAVSCLIGRPATEDHLAICNYVATTGSSLDKGRAIAVATLLSAAYTCE